MKKLLKQRSGHEKAVSILSEHKTACLEERLKNFCLGHKHVYLYGAGYYANLYKSILSYYQLRAEGVILSKKTMRFYDYLPVYAWDEIKENITGECGIILAVSKNIQGEILQANNFTCDVLALDDDEFSALTCGPALKKIASISNGRPVSPAGKLSLSGEKILLVQLEVTFGDMVWSSGLLREIKRNFPSSPITMVINASFKELFKECPYIEEIIPYDGLYSTDGKIDYFGNFCQWMERMFSSRKGEFAAVFLPRLLPGDAFDLWENVFLAVYCEAKYLFAHSSDSMVKRAYIAKKLEPYFSGIIHHTEAQHEVERDLSLLQLCGSTISSDKMELWLGQKEKRMAEALFAAAGADDSYCKIALGVVGSEAKRSWPAEKYRDLCKKLAEMTDKRFCVVICGGQDALASADCIKKENPLLCINTAGSTTLLEVAAIINRCDFYVGSDTGVMQMAAALGKDIVEISASLQDAPPTYGHTPERTGPWRVKGIVLRPVQGLDGCRYVCRKKFAHCINEISVDEVLEAVVQVMNGHGRQF